jgi:hypothetical protein
MALKKEIVYQLVKWERILEEKKVRYKEAWKQLRTRDKLITTALVGAGICQVIVGIILIIMES